ncbi:hypothetical protein Aperf_G00000013002 [Anoplocephala perfoliata]
MSQQLFDPERNTISVNYFNQLRRRGRFLDLTIISKENQSVRAHRLVICAQFPSIENKLDDADSGKVEWKRFPSRIENLNLNEIWSVANVTANEELKGVCVCLMAKNFELYSRSKCFFVHTRLKDLRALLSNSEIRSTDATNKLSAISSWMAAADSATERVKRESELENLLEDIDLSGLPKSFFIDLAMENTHIDLPEACRKSLLKKCKAMEERGRSATRISGAESRERQPSFPPLGIGQQRILGAVPHKWQRPLPPPVFRPPEISANTSLDLPPIFKREKLFVFGDGVIYSNRFLRSVPEIEGGISCSYSFILRGNVEVLAFNDDIFIIGGRTQTALSVSQVDKVDTRSGNITSVQSMLCRRDSVSAVVSGQSIFVFGGYDTTRRTTLSSCEKYDPSSNTWTSVADMSVARYGSGAAHIPGLGELVVGGRSQPNVNEALNVAELFSSGDGNWRTIAPMLCSRGFPRATYFDQSVIVAGDLHNHFHTVERLTLTAGPTPQWSMLCTGFSLPTNLSSACVFRGKFLVSFENAEIYELKDLQIG